MSTSQDCPAPRTTPTPTPENHPGFPAWKTKKLKTKIVQPISQISICPKNLTLKKGTQSKGSLSCCRTTFSPEGGRSHAGVAEVSLLWLTCWQVVKILTGPAFSSHLLFEYESISLPSLALLSLPTQACAQDCQCLFHVQALFRCDAHPCTSSHLPSVRKKASALSLAEM